MNFEEWYKFGTPDEQGCFMGDAQKGWDACKNEILKIIEDEIDNGDLSIVKAAKKIREEI